MMTMIRLGLAIANLLAVHQGGEVDSVVLGDLEFRVEHEQDGAQAPLRALVKAIDPRTQTVRWTLPIYQGRSRNYRPEGMSNPRIASLAPFARGLIASTQDGATFYIDPAARSVVLVHDRRVGETECPVHHRPLDGIVVPIHYGMATGRPISKDQREAYPGVELPIEGGCCVMEEKAAILNACPECRQLGR